MLVTAMTAVTVFMPQIDTQSRNHCSQVHNKKPSPKGYAIISAALCKPVCRSVCQESLHYRYDVPQNKKEHYKPPRINRLEQVCIQPPQTLLVKSLKIGHNIAVAVHVKNYNAAV